MYRVGQSRHEACQTHGCQQSIHHASYPGPLSAAAEAVDDELDRLGRVKARRSRVRQQPTENSALTEKRLFAHTGLKFSLAAFLPSIFYRFVFAVSESFWHLAKSGKYLPPCHTTRGTNHLLETPLRQRSCQRAEKRQLAELCCANELAERRSNGKLSYFFYLVVPTYKL